MRKWRLARGDSPEKISRHCGRCDGDDWNLCLTMQAWTLHPAALDRTVFMASRLRLRLRIVQNDRGRAGVFRVGDLRVVSAFASLQHCDISAPKIRKLFSGTTRSGAGHRSNAGGDVAAGG